MQMICLRPATQTLTFSLWVLGEVEEFGKELSPSSLGSLRQRRNSLPPSRVSWVSGQDHPQANFQSLQLLNEVQKGKGESQFWSEL